jgi:DNA-binding transcriptional LysR family regulator
MTEKQIQYFLAVYRNGSITKAAEELYVSRPVISRALSAMEKMVGFSLFDRKSDGITPTERGRILFEMLEEFIKTYELTVQKLRNIDFSTDERSVRIGILNASGGWFYPLIYRPFHEKHPDIAIIVEGIQTEEASDLIVNGTLDMAIAPKINDSALIASLYLYTAQWVLCAPKNFEYSEASEVELSEVGKLSVAILETLPPPFYEYKSKVLSTRQPEMVRIAVANGYAYAVLPMELCAFWDDVLIKPFVPPQLPPIYLLWNKAVPHGSAFKAFYDFICEYDFEPLRRSWGGYDPKLL